MTWRFLTLPYSFFVVEMCRLERLMPVKSFSVVDGFPAVEENDEVALGVALEYDGGMSTSELAGERPENDFVPLPFGRLAGKGGAGAGISWSI